MKIEFVNHASIVIDAGDARLMTDPWFEGAAFDGGWALLSPTAFAYDRFRTITHLWFSHEHPDHFSPATIKKIPPQARRHITALFQTTRDRKVVEYLRRQGFQEVRELPPGEWVRLSPRLEMLCTPCPGMADSWAAFRADGTTLLNMNDCPLTDRRQARQIRAVVGKVDVLATQFSISGWDGNAEELERRRAGAQAMLARAVLQCEEFAPAAVIPFASFIWFCHEENRYMNEGFLPIADVDAGLQRRTGTQPVWLYPGDVWSVGAPSDNGPALQRYAHDLASLPARPRTSSPSLSAEELVAASREFCRTIAKGSSRLRLRLQWARMARRAAPARRPRRSRFLTLTPEPPSVWVPDQARAYRFHHAHGLRAAELAESECDVVIGSQPLHYAFTNLWGGQTLLINGRFRETRPGGRQRLFDFFHFAAWRNEGGVVTWRGLAKGVWQRLRRIEPRAAARA